MNANSPIMQRERSLGGRSTEFKKTVWDWKNGGPQTELTAIRMPILAGFVISIKYEID